MLFDPTADACALLRCAISDRSRAVEQVMFRTREIKKAASTLDVARNSTDTASDTLIGSQASRASQPYLPLSCIIDKIYLSFRWMLPALRRAGGEHLWL